MLCFFLYTLLRGKEIHLVLLHVLYSSIDNPETHSFSNEEEEFLKREKLYGYKKVLWSIVKFSVEIDH